jgi:hypothetical protein
MRLVLLAIILLLALTLVNALMLRHDMRVFHHSNYAPIHLGVRRESHYGWDLFIWREIGAFFITAVLYGIVASLVRKRKIRE